MTEQLTWDIIDKMTDEIIADFKEHHKPIDSYEQTRMGKIIMKHLGRIANRAD